jgi:hypothetical protein
MGKNVLKSSPLKPVSQYSKHVIDGPSVVNFQNCVQTDGGHLGWSFGSLDIILKVDHLRTIHAMFALNWLTDFRGNFF